MQKSELKDIYTSIIVPETENILRTHLGLFFVDNAFELFFSEYNVLYEYYSKKYMHPNSSGLDYHKEIATIVIALLKVRLIKTMSSDYYVDAGIKHAFNETLAFNTGCDMLKSILVCNYRDDEEMDAKKRNFCADFFDQSGLVFPKTTYQNYYQNTITEFYYTSREGSFNFLSLSDKFFWIELFNKSYANQIYYKKCDN